MPRVSVVVPSYQNARFIRATLASVLAQTYADVEVIVADHSSTDGTWDLLQPYADDSRVRLLVTPTGGGVGGNWNRVTEAATGELVKLVCGDDLIYPELLARQVAAFDAYGPRVAVVASSRDIIDAGGRVIARNVGLGGLRGLVDGRTALRRSVLAGANLFGEPGCVLLRRTVLAEIGGWHGDPSFMIDQATYSRALLRGDLVAVPGPLAAFRVSATQLSVDLARAQARSAAELHRQLAALEPGLLSKSDIRRGNLMAMLRAGQRRAVYRYLAGRGRLQPPPLEDRSNEQRDQRNRDQDAAS